MKYNSLLKVLFALSILLVAEKSLSMAPPPPPPPAAGGPQVPIDGGISLLVAAGVGYGAKKYYDKQKKNKEEKSEL
jgi:hypothetical protein